MLSDTSNMFLLLFVLAVDAGHIRYPDWNYLCTCGFPDMSSTIGSADRDGCCPNWKYYSYMNDL